MINDCAFLNYVKSIWYLRVITVMKRVSFIAGFVFLSACASNTGIISIGSNKYLIAKQAATGFPGTGGIKTESLKEAASYCTSKAKDLNVINLQESEGPYILGKYPRVELTFTCL